MSENCFGQDIIKILKLEKTENKNRAYKSEPQNVLK